MWQHTQTAGNSQEQEATELTEVISPFPQSSLFREDIETKGSFGTSTFTVEIHPDSIRWSASGCLSK